MPWPTYQITTFADVPFRGNPAFVVLADDAIPLDVCKQVRDELREPVLTIVTCHPTGGRVRFVTEQGVHSGPAHAMHAAAWVVLNRADRPLDRAILQLDERKTVSAYRNGEMISVEWNAMEAFPSDDAEAVMAALGIRPMLTFGSSFGTVAILSEENDVVSIHPDDAAISALRDATLIVTAPSKRADFVVRAFAPRLGLPEDPVCGTAHRIIAPYWAERLGRKELISWQASPRGGELHCRVAGDVVTITGHAKPFLTGSIDVPR